MTTFSREEIAATCERAVIAFVRAFRRVPSATEQEIIVSALVRFFNEPDAPSTRLQ
ncbi:hypothetical protein C9413_32305 [Rhizobium sp. SEMIA 4085]|uniref:Uncharacterized protein n=1 Tax=Rhizobium gallicum bv. gallicum R602sp TaxID=1041138 RepID=A0A0B4X410_9HYPH|nr:MULTISPECIES: hypothetical protein [Rhizobium]AJD41272.1 hypothetical protein RGR602_CH01941 [Rhizobium gallicum bv. gallicum R602sp]NNH33874.1 hypothetical protein [Rhizobium sp. SEMIA 4085]